MCVDVEGTSNTIYLDYIASLIRIERFRKKYKTWTVLFWWNCNIKIENVQRYMFFLWVCVLLFGLDKG